MVVVVIGSLVKKHQNQIEFILLSHLDCCLILDRIRIKLCKVARSPLWLAMCLSIFPHVFCAT